MVYGTNFVFNGQDSKDYNLMLCSIGNDSETELNMGLNYEISNYKTNNKIFDYGAKHEDVLVFNMTVIHCDESPFDRQQIREIMRWLDDCKELKWLSYYDFEEDMDINYFCRITSKEKIKCADKIIGFRFEVTCDSPYAYSDIKTIKLTKENTDNHKYIFSKQFFVNTDRAILPCIYFHPNEPSYSYYDVICNLENADGSKCSSNFICKQNQILSNKILIMDCENECIFFEDMTIPLFYNTVKDNNDIIPRFVDNFIKLKHGINSLEFITNEGCSNIELKYREIYKIGEF